MRLNGNAIIISRLLTAFSKLSVPTEASPNAVAVIIMPQITLWIFEGFSIPLSEKILTTNMAESTELIMAVNIKIELNNIVTSLNGKYSKKSNSEVKIELKGFSDIDF